jgi:hypothetical protein
MSKKQLEKYKAKKRYQKWATARLAYIEGLKQGKALNMSNPNEPRFEDDFDCDEEPQEITVMGENEITLYSIASTKAHNYAHEYNPSTGKATMKSNYAELKEAYTAGFLEGFAHRLTAQQPNAGE